MTHVIDGQTGKRLVPVTHNCQRNAKEIVQSTKLSHNIECNSLATDNSFCCTVLAMGMDFKAVKK